MTDKVIFLTTTGASTWQVPSDWSGTNTIICIGGGAGGSGGVTTSGGEVGGAGGGWSRGDEGAGGGEGKFE